MRMDLGSSTELITLKPWSTGKQLPLGLSVFDHGDGQSNAQSKRVARKRTKFYGEMDNINFQATSSAANASHGCWLLDQTKGKK